MRGEYYTFATRRVFTGKNPPGGDFLHAKSLPHGGFLPVNSLRGRLFRGAISYRDTGPGCPKPRTPTEGLPQLVGRVLVPANPTHGSALRAYSFDFLASPRSRNHVDFVPTPLVWSNVFGDNVNGEASS